MNGRGRNTAQAWNDRTASRFRISGLVALYTRISRALRWRDSRPAIQSAPVERDVAAVSPKLTETDEPLLSRRNYCAEAARWHRLRGDTRMYHFWSEQAKAELNAILARGRG